MGLSHKRYVCSCFIEGMSVTLYWLFNYYLQMDERWRIEKMTAENDNLNRKLHVDKRWERNKLYIHIWTFTNEDKIGWFT